MRKIYKGFFIAFVVILTFLLGNNSSKTVSADNKESVNYNKETIYNAASNYEKKEDRTIIIGDDKNYPPYSFIDENGNPSGFDIELAKAAAEAMGFKVKFKLGVWSDVRNELENGQIDAISGMFYSKEREKNYSFTAKYTKTNADVFTRKDKSVKDISELKGRTVVVETDEISGEYLKNENLDIKFIEVDSSEEALKLVAAKKYDYAVVSTLLGNYYIKKDKFSNLKGNGLAINSDDYCFAVKKGNDDLLFTLNGGLQILKATGKYDEIYNKWLGIYEEKTFYQQLIEHAWLIAAAALSIILLLLWNTTLKRRVVVRTRELSEANEALNKSKEELLASNEEIEASYNELVAIEEELRSQYEMLIESEENLKKSEERNRAIVMAIPDIIFVIDENAVFKDCQTKDNSVLIVPKSEFIGKTLWDVLPHEIAEIGFEKIKSALENDSLESFQYEIDTPAGIKYYELRVVKCREKETIAISRDITLRHIAEKELEEEKELLKTTLLSVGDGVIVTDIYGDVIILNKAAETLIGLKEQETKLMKFEDAFNIVDEVTKEKCDNPVKKALKSMTSQEATEYKILITKDCKEKMISYNVSLIKDNFGYIKGTVLVLRDVTVERKNQKKIEFLSYNDQLTGLYNRRFFEEELKRLDNKENLPFTIVMADVNGLKLINDSFGHAVGDELLKKVAAVMLNGCGNKGVVSRIGGDEFVILLPKTNIFEADELLKYISALSSKEQVASISLSISFGFDTKCYDDENIFEVLKKAEDSMYKKKLFEGPSMRGKTIGAIVNTLHEKNKREEQHSHRVSEYCDCLGKAMNLPDGEIQELRTVGLLHDIGKIAIEENILNKPGKLTDEEWEAIKRHPEIGYRILSSVNDMAELAEYVLAHHERWDGTGYPKGLKGEEIPLKSRIIAIADAFDAMISERAYRSALPKEVAVEEIIKNAGIQFDPELVKVFIEKVV
ncbi:transporter substrate-binding domain-containing protein [Clostridium sp. PL3]|uniref:Transporter substrate-binding domain-containing protein n=1 Tax=Clostridium thailandense TaxID=2794346 RepID=A0A949WPI9_9CLOT|nr:transporter substrate-binding domain-containing protein [Clostridium thailandense]MBV7271341.1 transporter substrate-binding domain-containing protein [Clostridium thailandense]